ncbi:MAG: hypothetical protein QME76_04365 [Bacillota bacterium]|nr:hypothetical protein [Bacillota bacterium]
MPQKPAYRLITNGSLVQRFFQGFRHLLQGEPAVQHQNPDEFPVVMLITPAQFRPKPVVNVREGCHTEGPGLGKRPGFV